jgi:hypothetical protein
VDIAVSGRHVHPSRLVSLAEAIGARVSNEEGEWIARLQLTGCWPIPPRDETFGKGSSCIVGTDVPISCAEVELTNRARRAGWEGGWISAFNPFDRRFPADWRPALINEPEARSLLGQEFPSVAVRVSGIPDLVLARGGSVVAAECKRVRGAYRDNDCARKSGGDSFKRTQTDWASEVIAAGISRDALLTVWWDRADASPCAQD